WLPLEAAPRDRKTRSDRRSDDRHVRALVVWPAHDGRRGRQRQPATFGLELFGTMAGPRRVAEYGRVPRELESPVFAGVDRRERFFERPRVHGTARRVVKESPRAPRPGGEV